ncbi:hypothetical protein EV649_1431 [Kribbella sp. VKM Ac-2569]|nr:hypothetical protein EV649_1431 [Kribbella sp. VKM Ac-2569]
MMDKVDLGVSPPQAAHLRVHDYNLAPWALYFTTCAAALITTIAYH